ncbi:MULTISPECIES: hypothetical protein [unclassified Modestobacter]
MNVHALLTDATADVDTAVHPDTVRADLIRGRRAAHRRRLRRGGVAGLVMAGAFAGAVALGSTETPAAPLAGPGVDRVLEPGTIQLVDYTGEQLAGYAVDEVPDGWALLDADEYALTIGPSGVPGTDPNSYVGKLTVLLMSQDETMPAEGTEVTIGSTIGRVVTEAGRGGSAAPFDFSLFYVDPASGQPVRIQVPPALGWTAQQAADFATGVHVTTAAERGVG